MEDEKQQFEGVGAHGEDTALHNAAESKAQDGVVAATPATAPVAVAHTTSDVSEPLSPTTTANPAAASKPTAPVAVEQQAPRPGSESEGAASGPGSPALKAAGFVTPSSYLRPVVREKGGDGVGSGIGPGNPMGGSRPTTGTSGGVKAMHPLDKEQIEGLVSAYVSKEESVRFTGARG